MGKADIDYDQLDPGIREVVRVLRGYGYHTTDSGDGITKLGEMGCVIDQPHVVIALEFPFNAIHDALALKERLRHSFDEPWEVQASYDTEDKQGLLYAYIPKEHKEES